MPPASMMRGHIAIVLSVRAFVRPSVRQSVRPSVRTKFILSIKAMLLPTKL